MSDSKSLKKSTNPRGKRFFVSSYNEKQPERMKSVRAAVLLSYEAFLVSQPL